MFVRVCLFVCVCVCVCMLLCACMFVHVHVSVDVDVGLCVHACAFALMSKTCEFKFHKFCENSHVSMVFP
jgi:hypothetical protein